MACIPSRRADAATGRASCSLCKGKIEEGELKAVEWKSSAFKDGFDKKNYKTGCRTLAGPLDARKMLLLRVADQLAYSRDDAQKAFVRRRRSKS